MEKFKGSDLLGSFYELSSLLKFSLDQIFCSLNIRYESHCLINPEFAFFRPMRRDKRTKRIQNAGLRLISNTNNIVRASLELLSDSGLAVFSSSFAFFLVHSSHNETLGVNFFPS